MTDYFALLDEPRRPWLDVDALKAKFHSLSAEAHPDRFHSRSESERQAANARYSELNNAYQILREPKDRLKHLLELEGGGKPGGIERAPDDDLDLFMRIGQLCRETDAFLVERTKAASPMVKVQFFQQALEWTDRLQQLTTDLNQRITSLEAGLQSMNPIWDAAPKPGDPNRAASLPLDQLEQIYRTLSFHSRWMSQLQDRVVQLSL